LIFPFGLGQQLEFIEGEGPKLQKIENRIPEFDEKSFTEKTKNIFETVSRVAAEKPKNATLIGFCGAPFTVACYLLGDSKTGFETALKRAESEPELFKKLLAVLVQASVFYLIRQVKAGAEALQIFDSHSGLVPPRKFNDYVLNPTKEIIAGVRKAYPNVPVIVFPRGTPQEFLPRFAAGVDATALSLDTHADLVQAARDIPAVLQGNLDPILMEGEEKPMRLAAEAILKTLQKPFIFNLGHGLNPQAKPENVAALATFVQGWKR
jgi:uroporphyrinogen decarboxylase